MNKLRVLLADDHIVMRTGLRALLERQPNLEVIGGCENGRETVELAASLRPDVVVMDIGMPMLNGIEATNEVAAWRSFASISNWNQSVCAMFGYVRCPYDRIDVTRFSRWLDSYR